jgi:hypothetical protein
MAEMPQKKTRGKKRVAVGFLRALIALQRRRNFDWPRASWRKIKSRVVEREREEAFTSCVLAWIRAKLIQ